MHGSKIYGLDKCNDNGKKAGILANKVCNCVFTFWNIFLLYSATANNIIIITTPFAEREPAHDSESTLYPFPWMVITCISGADFQY